MKPIHNDRLLRALKREPVDATPIWIMRQAGRYLPEYREIRQKAGSFLQLCKTPELACQVTLQPLARFELDAAILFSDILTIPDAMGLGLYFKEGEGPGFLKKITSRRDIENLPIPDPDLHLNYVLQTIGLIQQSLQGKVPLIGFCGSPWTLATYIIEGKADKNFPSIRKMLQSDPASLHLLLQKLATAVHLHLKAQILAGVDAVMVFDTWGGLLATDHYKTFSLAYIKAALHALPLNTPVILFTKSGGQWLELMTETGCQALGLDWLIPLSEARKRVGDHVALQGNMDPAILHTTPTEIEDEVKRLLADFGPGPGHIFNLGHGITPTVPPEHVAVLVNAVHHFSRSYHQ